MRYPLIQSTDHLVLFLTLWLATTPPPSTAFLELPPVVARKKSLDESPNNVFRTQGALWLAGFGKKKKESRERNSSSSFSNVTIVGIDEPETSKRRRQRKQRSDEFEARRKAWEDKYGSADALCRTFGGCANPIWGDLDGEATRELYHTLLPRSLWALQEADILQPEELAPLAYQARVAAKEYARRRSTLPNRLLAMGFDGYRSWKRDGNPLNTKGLSWEDLWDKYEAQIVQEECNSELKQGKKCLLDREALTRRIYTRILERSCATNEAFDRMFLNKSQQQQSKPISGELGDLATIANQLDHDVRDLLLRPEERKKMWKTQLKAEKERAKTEEKAVEEAEKVKKEKTKKRLKVLKVKRKEIKKEEKKITEQAKKQQALLENDKGEERIDQNSEEVDDETKQAQYNVLRIAANTRRKFREL
uniref:Uncharacterized protein n=2 Tax=Amphora coffeiformis TaxID=265554 RepID=A0A7S3P3N9_9STRA